MTYDKEIGMWHKKNFANYIIDDCYKTKYFFDEEGRIKNNYEYSNNKKNIILLGDSNIEALMVNNKNIIHNSLYNEIYGKYNVLNYSLSGTGPTQHLEILKNKIKLNKVIKLIHFVFLENDLGDGNPNNFNGTNRPKVHLEFENLDNYVTIKPKKYDTKEMFRDFLGNFGEGFTGSGTKPNFFGGGDGSEGLAVVLGREQAGRQEEVGGGGEALHRGPRGLRARGRRGRASTGREGAPEVVRARRPRRELARALLQPGQSRPARTPCCRRRPRCARTSIAFFALAAGLWRRRSRSAPWHLALVVHTALQCAFLLEKVGDLL